MLAKRFVTRLHNTRSYGSICSALYVPGNQERMLNKVLQFEPNVVVPDIEDSVPPLKKPDARKMINAKLPELRQKMAESTYIFPRPNDLETEWFYDDIDQVVCPKTKNLIDGFCIPKVNNKEMVQEIDEALNKLEAKLDLKQGTYKVIAQIETTESITKMDEIFQTGKNRIIAGAFGADDFLTDFGIERRYNLEELDYFRKKFALHCAANNVVSIDTPYVHFKNPEGLKEELEYLKGIGIKAKFAIHPLQIDIINEAFRPTEEQIKYAQGLVEAFEKAMEEGKAAIDYQNKMCDVPVYKRMVNVLTRAGLR